ncbi:MAG TPA: hypothetical protein VIU62_23620 [Chloroflexota bacterium]
MALIAHLGAASIDGNGFTSGSIDTTGANLLVLALVDYNGTATFSDSKGNTWTARTMYGTTFTAGGTLTIYYAKNPSVGTAHTITVSATGAYPSITVQAHSSIDTTAPYDVENGAAASAVTSIQPGSITPGSNGELIISALGIGGVTTGTAIDSSFTITDTNPNSAGADIGGSLAYLYQGTAAAVNPTWSWTSAFDMRASIASFKAAAGAAPIPNRIYRILQAINRAATY